MPIICHVVGFEFVNCLFIACHNKDSGVKECAVKNTKEKNGETKVNNVCLPQLNVLQNILAVFFHIFYIFCSLSEITNFLIKKGLVKIIYHY